MKALVTDQEVLVFLRPLDLVAYLRAHGWRPFDEHRDLDRDLLDPALDSIEPGLESTARHAPRGSGRRDRSTAANCPSSVD